ncbi:anti-sigma B factor antagonist [Algoriphagus zhangzhouensis]|uniref:Anti-sigma factor antagonist n=2 Tax=Algoriphagus zhangzhouensis TaxID=1073327 RepID=A0A1M7ZK57_9BACT|nr:anti-sigma B factor antagonist [Algoriphagus zhangzhouensis]SHO65192.1 anti-sigma B factor antagonist [Algoriphagus zhangzhouensis]
MEIVKRNNAKIDQLNNMKLTYHTEKDDKAQYLYIKGDLIGDEVGPKLVEVVSDAVEEGVKTFVVDLSEVRYISSSGIGLLITMLTKMRNIGGEVYLTSPSDHVKKLLIITKLNNIFTVFDSVEDFKNKD